MMEKELKEFGLTGNEVKIYLTLLKTEGMAPAELANKTGFSRPYVYDALSHLKEKQIVGEIIKNSKKNFVAANPKRLEEMALLKLEKIQSIIPDLEKLKGEATDEIKVELHKGPRIYKVLLADITATLKKGGEVLIFGIDDGFLINSDPYYLEYLERYYGRIKKLGIKEKVIVKNGAKIFEKWRTTSYRVISNKIIGNTAFEVYGNKVAIFIWGKPNCLVLIENKEAAESYRNQFEILWKNSDSKSI